MGFLSYLWGIRADQPQPPVPVQTFGVITDADPFTETKCDNLDVAIYAVTEAIKYGAKQVQITVYVK